MSKRPSLCLSFLLALMAAASPLHAAVNDIFPGDYFPLPPGSMGVALYAYERDSSGPYANGRQLLKGSVATSILALRVNRVFKVGETTVTPVMVLPWTQSKVSPAPFASLFGEEAQGFADLRLGTTVTLINDPDNAHYLGATVMIVAPTGDYDGRRLVNSGENRWKFVLGGGWQKDVTPRFLVELAPEIAFYGANDDYVGGRRLEQDPSYALTGYLRYRFSRAWHTHLGAQVNRGGATRVANVDQHNAAGNHRVTAGLSLFLTAQQQIIMRLARETRIVNGLRTDREISLRYQQYF